MCDGVGGCPLIRILNGLNGAQRLNDLNGLNIQRSDFDE